MRLKKILLIVFALVAITSTVQAKNRNKQVYVYGFAASFNDSTVYFTDIQLLDSAYISRNGFLYGRDSYSYQLKQYMESKGVFQPTCVTFFATSRKMIEKKFVSLKKRYVKGRNYNIKYITTADFSYTPVVPDPSELNKISAKKEKKGKTKAAISTSKN